MHLLITRPEPEADAWKAHLSALGITVTVDPLLVIEQLPVPVLDLSGVQALVVTSRNALRALTASAALEAAVKLPLFAVGPGTAALATGAGFCHVIQGSGSARDLVPLIVGQATPGGGILLQLSGDKIAFDLETVLRPAGFRFARQVVYRSRPATRLASSTVAALDSGAIDSVMLTSPLAARTFLALAIKHGISECCQRLVYICLSQTIAETVAPLNPQVVHVAAAPNSDSTLALIETLANPNS